MKKALIAICMLITATLAAPGGAMAETACSSVKIEILQELTLERIAFDAKLKVTNNIPDKSLDHLRVDIVIRDGAGNEKGELFFIKAPDCTNVSDVSGNGSVVPNTVAEVHWLIIPTPGAGGEDPDGVRYWVGATMSYDIDGEKQTVPITPVSILVKPEPLLYLDYFTPYQVLGDNPFTAKTEAPVPYPLAVRVMNDGFGTAKSLKITSAQPRIVENTQGLLIDFKILGSSVNDQPVANTLAPYFGDVPSKTGATAYWQMISTLSGKITEFNVTFTHSSELGGELTSLLKETNAHYLVHMVRNNLPGRDTNLDFLAAHDVTLGKLLPQYIMESEIPAGGEDRYDSVSLVSVAQVTALPPRPTPEQPAVTMGIDPSPTGWVYATTADPGKGLLKLYNVIRADGVVLDPNNFWIQEYLDDNYQQKFSVNILDYRSEAVPAPGTYTLVYEKPVPDDAAPESNVVYDGPAYKSESGTIYITPDTKVVVTAQDNEGGSGVDAMLMKLSGRDTDFIDAYPFDIADEGNYTLEYYSTDRAGNTEDAKSGSIVVDATAPEISSFTVQPDTFSPTAPEGIAADRSVELAVTASDGVDTLPVTLEVMGPDGAIVRTINAAAVSGETLRVSWDGTDDDGKVLPTGTYTVRATVDDGLYEDSGEAVHKTVAEAAVTIEDWFVGEPIDPNLSGEQMYPKASGTRVVWQDNRSGHWQVYMKDLVGGQSAVVSAGNGERPAIDGDIVAWQDDSSGNYRIRYYDITTGAEKTIDSDPAGQYAARSEERPATGGGWVAWQDDRGGNWDIFAYNIATGEVKQVTSHERDQMHPAISGGTLYWEDYRHGLGEIYSFDLATGVETRLTYDPENQTEPAADGGLVVWTDQRDGGRDIYVKDGPSPETRLSYSQADEAEPAILGGTVVYTDYDKGQDDPDLAFVQIVSGVGGRLTNSPARQEQAAVTEGHVLWQDDRDGVYQVYAAPFDVEPVPVRAKINRGYNLVAAGALMAAEYPTASDLIAGVGAELGVDRVMMYDAYSAKAVEATDSGTGGNFVITPGSGLVIYADSPGTLDVAESGEDRSYTLLPGVNQIGILKAPAGYRAYDLMESVGLPNIQSVRRFDPGTGTWQTASIREKDGETQAVGVNFQVRPGEGLIITMKQRVDGWKP